jgi:cytochrome c oxidase subunit IV
MVLSYEESVKAVWKGFMVLLLVTLGEVAVALIGNGHIISGVTLPKVFMYPAMIALSVYKAYYIVYNFMHMAHEVKGLAMSVLLPVCLLSWGVVAFFSEGNYWKNERQLIQEKNHLEAKPVSAPATTKPLGVSDTKVIAPAKI